MSTLNVVTLHSFNPLFYGIRQRGSCALEAPPENEPAGCRSRRVLKFAVLPLVAIYTPLLAESYRTSRSVVVSIPILAAGIGCGDRLLGNRRFWRAATPRLRIG